ncbi:MobQ family relaxase [Mesobacillus foraminis]|uniref:MobA/MobL family protein n=1 Tax=Mesobacillus foraminis TaxID=279826 RepID=A0A4V6NKJ2_9BACI|nr:MobQ family relaxase [Mesobacillus foraminis]TCN18410.1 MobA/MobL family protein [Mesobacillus foraminis]
MAIYHFSNQIISRKKQQNTIAAAAYRSGEKLLDERTNEVKYYKREVEPITRILAPSHAPDWVYDRQRLWNEVERKEKQWNAQLAREINVALPKELSNEEQEQLAIEFCNEVFVSDGMVADLAIHRDNEDNPHFHVMLTIRPFNEDGTWGNKQKKTKEMVNEKLQVKALHTTDWNTKEKLLHWREQWAVFANHYLEKNGFAVRITHLSNKDQGIETLPTIHEGFVARQMQKEGKQSERIQINQERKEYNQVVIDIQEAKREKEIHRRNEKFTRRFTPAEKKQLREAAKTLRLFVNLENIIKRRNQLQKWQDRLEFSSDSIDKYKKLNRIEKETEILNAAEVILENEADRFLKKYYPDIKREELSGNQKIEIVDVTVSNNKLLSLSEIENITKEIEKNQIERELAGLLNNRAHFVLSLQNEIRNAELEFEQLRVTNRINFADESTIKNVPEEVLNKIRLVLNLKSQMEKSLELMDRLYDYQLEEMYPNWDGRDYLTIEQKEFFVMAQEYYGRTIIPQDIANPPRKYSKEDQQRIIFYLDQMNSQNESEKQIQYRETLLSEYPDFQLHNKSFLNMFYLECRRLADEIGTESLDQLNNILMGRFVREGEGAPPHPSDTFTSHHSDSQNFIPTYGSDFFSILESAIREADRKWREDEFEQQKRKNKKKKRKGLDR